MTDEARGTGLGRALIAEAPSSGRGRADAGASSSTWPRTTTRAIEVYRRPGFGTEPGAPGRTMLIARRL